MSTSAIQRILDDYDGEWSTFAARRELASLVADIARLKTCVVEALAESAKYRHAVKFAVDVHGNESDPERKVFVPKGENPSAGGVAIKIHARDYPAGSTVWVSAFKPADATKEPTDADT